MEVRVSRVEADPTAFGLLVHAAWQSCADQADNRWPAWIARGVRRCRAKDKDEIEVLGEPRE
jgi:hypothetical protein